MILGKIFEKEKFLKCSQYVKAENAKINLNVKNFSNKIAYTKIIYNKASHAASDW